VLRRKYVREEWGKERERVRENNPNNPNNFNNPNNPRTIIVFSLHNKHIYTHTQLISLAASARRLPRTLKC
jgi:hypothetical protein